MSTTSTYSTASASRRPEIAAQSSAPLRGSGPRAPAAHPESALQAMASGFLDDLLSPVSVTADGSYSDAPDEHVITFLRPYDAELKRLAKLIEGRLGPETDDDGVGSFGTGQGAAEVDYWLGEQHGRAAAAEISAGLWRRGLAALCFHRSALHTVPPGVPAAGFLLVHGVSQSQAWPEMALCAGRLAFHLGSAAALAAAKAEEREQARSRAAEEDILSSLPHEPLIAAAAADPLPSPLAASARSPGTDALDIAVLTFITLLECFAHDDESKSAVDLIVCAAALVLVMAPLATKRVFGGPPGDLMTP